MEFKITFQSHIALIIHVYLFAFAGAQNFKRDDKGVSFAKFVKASSVKLDVIKLASQKVSRLGDCIFECINNKDCYSVNFGGIFDGKYSCELLGTDRFRRSSHLVASEEFDYYYIKTTCMKNPCQNGATCLPIYSRDEYKCVCLPGFTGQHCETVNWIHMTPSTVCFGAMGDSFGAFTTPTSGDVITFKLIYQSGYVECAGGYQSLWGCNHPVIPTGYRMGTYITDSQKNRLLPKDEYLNNPLVSDCPYLYYNLAGITPDSTELMFDNFSIPLSASAGQQFQLWFVEDLTNCLESNNAGGHNFNFTSHNFEKFID